MNTKRILIVSDSDAPGGMIKNLLKMADYSNISLASGKEGVEMIKDTRPVLVIVAGLEMDGMSGIELIEWTRREWPLIRIIAMSGAADQETAESRVRDAGADAFLPKPFKNKDLLGVVEALLAEA